MSDVKRSRLYWKSLKRPSSANKAKQHVAPRTVKWHNPKGEDLTKEEAIDDELEKLRGRLEHKYASKNNKARPAAVKKQKLHGARVEAATAVPTLIASVIHPTVQQISKNLESGQIGVMTW